MIFLSGASIFSEDASLCQVDRKLTHSPKSTVKTNLEHMQCLCGWSIPDQGQIRRSERHRRCPGIIQNSERVLKAWGWNDMVGYIHWQSHSPTASHDVGMQNSGIDKTGTKFQKISEEMSSVEIRDLRFMGALFGPPQCSSLTLAVPRTGKGQITKCRQHWGRRRLEERLDR